MKLEEWVNLATNRLHHAGVADPQLEAELIVAHVMSLALGEARAKIILGEKLEEEQQNLAENILSERESRVPLQHLTGRAAFRNIELEVGPGVFIPRPETEITAQFAIDELMADPGSAPRAVDLCTGSGAIALSIVSEDSRAEVWAVEKEVSAHAWAERNFSALGDGRANLLHADATQLTPELSAMRGSFTVVVSNPPYVPEDAIPRDPEVREFDPETALYSGADGLDLIRQLTSVGKQLLKPGGLIVFEHAEHQGAEVRAILERSGFKSAATHRDLTLRDRVTTARA